jgi:hypothetical protein
VKTWCDAIVRWGLVALAVFTPFAFGSVERWAQAILCGGIALLLLTFLLGLLWEEPLRRTAAWFATGLEVPLLLLVALVAFQLVPLPASLLRIVSPGSARVRTLPDLTRAVAEVGGPAAPDLHETVAALQGPAFRPVSVTPSETFDHLVLLVSLVALFYLILAWCDRRERACWMAGMLTVVGALVAVIGLVQSFTWNERVLWFRRAPASSYAFGPFVNHNHFAAYVEMILPVAIGLGLFLLERRDSSGGSVRPSGTPSGIVRAGDPEGERTRASSQAALVFFGAVILAVSLFYSLSRGGILSAVLSGSVLLVLSWRRLRSRRAAWALVAGLPALVLLFMGWIGIGIVKERFEAPEGVENEASYRSRAVIWSAAVRHLPEYLWVGAGLGAFEESFSPYAPPGSWARWDKAHNDYVQGAWEVGLLGVALFVWLAVLAVRRYGWPALKNRGEPLDLLRTGVALGILSVALHSAFDFSLQIPADGALFAVMVGLLVAFTRLSGHGNPAAEPVASDE